jgi:molybdenum cofactor synthesis domain-containing protein
MVLGLLRDALSPLARVSTAGDSADALVKAVEDTPDLLVSDFRMPGMDGRQLVEKLRSRSTTSGISVILLATKSDISEKLSVQDHVADDFVEKPFFLREATQRIKRVIDKIALEKMSRSSSSDGIVRGSLAQMNVIDLVQSLEMGRKSCLLTLTKDGDKCEMYFSEGQVPHATYGSLNGDAAVFKVLRWTGGNFQINFDGKTTQQTTSLNTQGLLMEGLRLLDEDKRDRGERNDISGPAVVRALEQHHFSVIETRIVADDHGAILKAIVELARKARLVVTTGGTGISARDVTPEATRTVCGRMLDGISERMRREGEKKTPFAVLSRGVCGVCGASVVLNLPGSPAGAVESLAFVIDVLPHAIQILAGKTEHMTN